MLYIYLVGSGVIFHRFHGRVLGPFPQQFMCIPCPGKRYHPFSSPVVLTKSLAAVLHDVVRLWMGLHTWPTLSAEVTLARLLTSQELCLNYDINILCQGRPAGSSWCTLYSCAHTANRCGLQNISPA
jgi:hypothetical protein